MSIDALWVIGAALMNFFLGAVWHSVFGREWMKAWSVGDEQVDPKDSTPYLVSFIGSLWASYGMFLIIKHIQPQNYWELLTIAVGSWLCIEVGMAAKHYAFARKSFKAFAVDFGVDLVGLVIMAFMVS